MNTPSPSRNGRDWHLSAEHINHLQDAFIEELVRVCQHAHFIDVRVRINGAFRNFQGDWIKWLKRFAVSETAKLETVECVQYGDVLIPRDDKNSDLKLPLRVGYCAITQTMQLFDAAGERAELGAVARAVNSAAPSATPASDKSNEQRGAVNQQGCSRSKASVATERTDRPSRSKPWQIPGEAALSEAVQHAIEEQMMNFGEIPDRISPDDFPEGYVLTRQEIVGGFLKVINAAIAVQSATQPTDPHRFEDSDEFKQLCDFYGEPHDVAALVRAQEAEIEHLRQQLPKPRGPESDPQNYRRG